jgi:hypothetical protein
MDKRRASPDSLRLEGSYANCFQVGYNAFEFLLDSGQSYSEDDAALFHTRLIISPFGVKSLVKMLLESIAGYERTFGPIPE